MKCFKKSFSRFSLQLLSFFLIVFISVVAQAADVQFSWTPNSEANLAGYKIYYGTASRNYSTSEDVGNPAPVDGKITATLTGFNAGGTYYFAATAYDTDGFESDYSTEVVWTAPASDPPPDVNTAPVASNAQITTNEDTEVSGNLGAVDSDGDSLTYSI
ncbi:MAG: hypothetical protein E4H46_00355, partial [Desulfobacterales bacterium]